MYCLHDTKLSQSIFAANARKMTRSHHSHHVRFDNGPDVITVTPIVEVVGNEDYDYEDEDYENEDYEDEDYEDEDYEDEDDEDEEQIQVANPSSPEDEDMPQKGPKYNHEAEELARQDKARMKLAKPPPFQLRKWQEQNKTQVIRASIFEELRAYEAQRRSTYCAKLEATQLYFKSLMNLLQNSIDETAKVYRLALGTSIAQSQYARAITQRGNHQVPRDSSPSAVLLHSWQEANTILAATLEESAVDIEKKVVAVLFSFQDTLLDQKTKFDNVGNPILAELEHVEAQVQRTWGTSWLLVNSMLASILNTVLCCSLEMIWILDKLTDQMPTGRRMASRWHQVQLEYPSSRNGARTDRSRMRTMPPLKTCG